MDSGRQDKIRYVSRYENVSTNQNDIVVRNVVAVKRRG